MACDVLRITITTVTLGSVFSIGPCVFNKYKRKMLGETVQALTSTRNWLRGFVSKFNFFIKDL